MAIFGGLLFGAWLAIVLIFCLLWLLFKFFPSLAIFMKWGFLLARAGAFFLLLFSFYLGYWVFVLWRKNENKSIKRLEK